MLFGEVVPYEATVLGPVQEEAEFVLRTTSVEPPAGRSRYPPRDVPRGFPPPGPGGGGPLLVPGGRRPEPRGLLPVDHHQPTMTTGGGGGGGGGDPYRLFVAGLNFATEEPEMHGYFSQFGEVADVSVSRTQGSSRGFGFVAFAKPQAASRCLDDPHPHVLDGRKLDIKPAHAKPFSTGQSPSSSSSYGPPARDGHPTATAAPILGGGGKKIFVGGLALTVSTEDLRAYFEAAGKGTLVDAIVMTDRGSGRSRGFGFVTFADAAVGRAVMCQPHEIHGRLVELKAAETKEERAAARELYHHHHGGGDHQAPQLHRHTHKSPPAVCGGPGAGAGAGGGGGGGPLAGGAPPFARGPPPGGPHQQPPIRGGPVPRDIL